MFVCIGAVEPVPFNVIEHFTSFLSADSNFKLLI